MWYSTKFKLGVFYGRAMSYPIMGYIQIRSPYEITKLPDITSVFLDILAYISYSWNIFWLCVPSYIQCLRGSTTICFYVSYLLFASVDTKNDLRQFFIPVKLIMMNPPMGDGKDILILKVHRSFVLRVLVFLNKQLYLLCIISLVNPLLHPLHYSEVLFFA